MKSIAKLNSGLYGGFTKILGTLAQGKETTDIISIDKGVLRDVTETGMLEADLTLLFGENSIDILDPVKTVKLMKLLKGGDEFVFLDDKEGNVYHITNLVSSITIPKASNSMSISVPELDEELSSIEVDSDTILTINEAQKMLEADSIILELSENNKIVRININDDYEYKFDLEYTGEITKYKVLNFAPLKGDSYELKICKKGDDIWLVNSIDLSVISANYMEKLIPVGEFDGFSLA